MKIRASALSILCFLVLQVAIGKDMVEEPVVQRSFKFMNGVGQLKKSKKGSTWQEDLILNGQVVVTYTRDEMRTSLHSIELFKVEKSKKAFLVMRWDKGAHSQTIEVWSLDREGLKKVWLGTSYYAGDVEIKANKLKVTYSMDSLPYPKEASKIFSF